MNPKPAHIPARYTQGWKALKPDLTTRNGFRWYPGTVVRSDHDTYDMNTTPCPANPGDGLCIAKTWKGAASAGYPTSTCVVVWYDPQLVAGQDENKLRVLGKVFVGDAYDAQQMIREGFARGADLSGAALAGADLYGANLSGTNLSGADLQGARLTKANLYEANLKGADLCRAELSQTDMGDADLSEANLYRANLRFAHLDGTLLTGTSLYGADFYGADPDPTKQR